MSKLTDALTEAERAIISNPATVEGYLDIKRQLAEITASMVTALDVVDDDPRAGITLAAGVTRGIAELPERDVRHLLLAAIDQFAAYVIAERSPSAVPSAADDFDEAERYAAQVEADEPPC